MATATKSKCACSPECTAQTGGTFAPGHDAKMVSRLTSAVLQATMTSEEALQTIASNGGSDALVAKARTLIERRLAEMSSAERRSNAKALSHLVGTDMKVWHGRRSFNAQVIETTDDGVVARHTSIGRGNGWCFHDPATGDQI